jgi:hypothetical protein
MCDCFDITQYKNVQYRDDNSGGVMMTTEL